jgi:hypothetical protein
VFITGSLLLCPDSEPAAGASAKNREIRQSYDDHGTNIVIALTV